MIGWKISSKRICWALLILLIASTTQAVNLDSLQNLINDQSLDEDTRNHARLEWVSNNVRNQPDSLVLVASELVRYFEQSNDTAAWAGSLYVLGSGHYYLSKLDTGEADLIRSTELFLDLGDTLKTVRGLAKIGDLYRAAGRFEEGQRALLGARRLLRQRPESGLAAMTEYGLGNIFYAVYKYEASIESYQNAYRHYMDAGQKLGASKALSGIANCEAVLKNYESSLSYSRRSIALMSPRGSDAEMAYQYFSLGDIFQKLDQLDSSRYYFEKCLESGEASKLTTYILWGHFGLIEHYVFTKNIRKARYHLDAAEKIANESEDYMVQNQLVDLDLKIALLAEDYEKAYRLKILQVERKDSLIGLEKAEAIEELTIQYETELKEADNEALRSKNKLFAQRQNWILIVSITVVTILLAVALALFFLFRRMRRLNQQLVDANAEKDALMGIVAHDLKSPLNKVGALIGAMEDSDLIGPVHQMFVDKMNQAIAQGGSLISELESITDLERKEEKALTPVALDVVVGQVADSFQPVAQKKSSRIKTHVQPLPAQVATYKDSLDRILGNLISNAIKFSPPSSQVEIHLESTSTHATVRIADQGPGIPAEELPKLFRKFSRLSPRPTAGESSTGLGLYIVHLLVEQINGTIKVDSTVGKGTEFTLEFPYMN